MTISGNLASSYVTSHVTRARERSLFIRLFHHCRVNNVNALTDPRYIPGGIFIPTDLKLNPRCV